MTTTPLTRFREDYAAHRAAEGRGYDREQLFALPYLAAGPHSTQWGVRSRTFDTFVKRVLVPMQRRLSRPLQLLDTGAGNGWLSWRTAALGVEATALDVRDDSVDGLGAGVWYLEDSGARFDRVAASFDALPLRSSTFDLVVFNASLHYALDLRAVLGEAIRVLRAGGSIAILDSPFYTRDADGRAMVSAKLQRAPETFGARATSLTALPFIEYLTAARLASVPEITWRRHRVRYPLWYEARAWRALIRRERVPSRFDVWEGRVA